MITQVDDVILSDEQQQAVALIKSWAESDEIKDFTLGGYAGTGKTTIIKTLLKLQSVIKKKMVVVAFTGKAVSVLRKKDIYATTAHALIYDVEVNFGVASFHLKSRLEDRPDIIIVDESSMISMELYADLKSFNKKILFVGDPGQLEPIGENPNLMAKTDFVLNKIHRQAEKSPIITFANDVRHGALPKLGVNNDGLLIRNKTITVKDLISHSQVICARNTTRISLNNRVRVALGHSTRLVLNEKIIVLRNNLEFGVFNGLILFVTEILATKQDHWLVNAKDETGKEYRNLPLWSEPFVQPLKKDAVIPKSKVYCDYAYAITCHKSQGSEWDSVLVYDEWMPPKVWSMARWRYTAITRAANRLTFCI